MNEGGTERVPSRLFEPLAHSEYRRRHGFVPTTRLNNALNAQKQALDELTPLTEDREILRKKILVLEFELKNPGTPRSREMAISKELTERLGLYTQLSIANDDVSEAQKKLDGVNKRVRSAQKELEGVTNDYVSARTVEYQQHQVSLSEFEQRKSRVTATANARSSSMLFEAKRVHNDRTDNWGTKLSDKMVLARASALRKESKLELDNAQVEIEAIETEAKNYQSSYEQRLRSTRDTLISVGGIDALTEGEETVKLRLAERK